ncbi:MAG: HIT family protein [Bacteroides sp.]|nr:HIT family protein [Ruminococcus flavefaciens]MCM1554865.1 HIT family protein [Bacteroides sp.]
MASIFSKIVAGEIPCYKVAEDGKHLAFLDIAPVTKGHVLVIPKKETDYIFDLEDAELAELMVFAKKVAKALIKVFPAPRIGMSVIGLDVPHTHVHLMPIHGGNDIDFGKEKLKLEASEMQAIADAVLKEFVG